MKSFFVGVGPIMEHVTGFGIKGFAASKITLTFNLAHCSENEMRKVAGAVKTVRSKMYHMSRINTRSTSSPILLTQFERRFDRNTTSIKINFFFGNFFEKITFGEVFS